MENPYAILSYIVAPALLTNAVAAMIMSTTGRFARAVDRSRMLMTALKNPTADAETDALRIQLSMTHRRLRFIVTGLASLYAAVGLFMLARWWR